MFIYFLNRYEVCATFIISASFLALISVGAYMFSHVSHDGPTIGAMAVVCLILAGLGLYEDVRRPGDLGSHGEVCDHPEALARAVGVLT